MKNEEICVLDSKRKHLLEAWPAIARDEKLYPKDPKTDQFTAEYWILKEDDLENFEKALNYLLLFRENCIRRHAPSCEFIEDVLIYQPTFGDSPGRVCLKLYLKEKE